MNGLCFVSHRTLPVSGKFLCSSQLQLCASATKTDNNNQLFNKTTLPFCLRTISVGRYCFDRCAKVLTSQSATNHVSNISPNITLTCVSVILVTLTEHYFDICFCWYLSL